MLAVTMRSVTRKHLSVVSGRARFAQVTVVELSAADGGASAQQPILILNHREMQRQSEDDNRFIGAAVQGVRETEARLGWRGLPLHISKIESSYVDMHPDAARAAAISAATALIEGDQ